MDSQRNFLDWFINPIKHHYADFEGRVGRQEYWMFVLVWILISIGLALLGIIIGEQIAELLHTLLTLAILVPSIALTARRLHDTNKSGWFQLIGLIPFIGWIILIVLLAQKGDEVANQYGDAPTVETGSEGESTSIPAVESTSTAPENNA